eukprot:TRINITY_DN4890_c0_g1_i1.p1 TRINITY_DN4890_c0_g1~~TRINITY_DN4890_c0_g1_i1.p1  ORF type:complete len:597 (+),score=70.63 TRINITY_DN4890_c0_g1_i1:184-1791(+)
MEAAIVLIDHGIHISATPDQLSDASGWVTVSWGGVRDPSSDDWIGAYSQTPFEISSAPAKYQFCNFSAAYLQTGHGALQMQLINMRAPYTFVFFRNGTIFPLAVALSNSVGFTNYNYPMQVHLSLTHNATEMQVSWTTLDAAEPQVLWGVTSGQYKWHSAASSNTYTKAQLCAAPATTVGWMDPGLFHTAVMSPLLPDTTYFYVVGDTYGYSEEFTFRSPPLVVAQSSFRFLAFGDQGKAEIDDTREHWNDEVASLNTSRLLSAEVASGQYPLVVHIGDIAYAVGYSAQWDQFMAQIQPVAANAAYMTCIGNHERDCPNSGSLFYGNDSGGECGIPYETRFVMPRPSFGQPWYSFDYGSVHFILFSTETVFAVDSPQYQFLQQDMASVDRSKTPWVVLGGHRPMYISSTYDQGYDSDQIVAQLLRDQLEPLLFQYKVDVALWGHHHSYQRTCGVYRSACMPPNADGSQGATVHVVIGMAGFDSSTNVLVPQPEIFKFVDAYTHGYTRWSATQTTLTVEFVSDIDGRVLDSFALSK